MLSVYILLTAGIVVLYYRTRNYKKSYFEGCEIRDHPMRILYRMTMYLEDRIFCRLRFWKNEKQQDAVRKIYLTDKTENLEYILKIKKSALGIAILCLFLLFGLLKSIEEALPQNRYIQTLPRPANGLGSVQVELDVLQEEEEEKISLEIGEYKYSEEEADEIIMEAYKELLVQLRGKNKGLDEVSSRLSMVPNVGDVDVSWQIENTDLVDFNGNVYPGNALGEGTLTRLTATLRFQEREKIYEIPVVIKTVSEEELSLEEKIQRTINANSSETDPEVGLPQEIEGKKIRYLRKSNGEAGRILVFGIAAAVLLVVAKDREMQGRVKKREEQMMRDYPEIVTKLTLLSEAGLSMKSSWNRIVEEYEKNKKNELRYAYEEMRLTNLKMKNGVPEAAAYAGFGIRCGLQPYLRLGSLLEQNITKGTKGLKTMLEKEAGAAFEDRKNHAKIKGGEAGTKLVFPMMLMLVVVIVIIIVPAFITMGI
ncbi:type II secretion system F family protein [Parasporobacterium paucivorans]|uniref:Type II secretion system protein F (GspF) n=1 Tax=Parasporobacterium paucivorans DSM 15970 TaxID=1122934 RepID=A0A1M6JAK4_9FIRM|nr:type II secretion system F family protein [Parasporobacterium paucivorans]SHJ43735.1 type II secretion system protein F (GspF) [Parasporobacterium paucivorans DSM 15970]